VRAAAQEDRWAYAATLELPLVPKRRTGQRGNRDGRRGLGFGWDSAGNAGLIVILQEPQEATLVTQVGAQVVADRLGVFANDSVVEPLVITEVEPVFLQIPLHVPIGFGDQHCVRVSSAHASDYFRPELMHRLSTGSTGPRLGEDLVGHQHRHRCRSASTISGYPSLSARTTGR
jgi:hypothetical protein